jgi:hypothetical protein
VLIVAVYTENCIYKAAKYAYGDFIAL